MKRKQCEDSHVAEACDEWLSTRNKQKIKPPSPRPKRRKSSVYKGFVRQPSSSLWQLSRDEAPHPLLFTATKQTNIQGFFTPKTTEDKEARQEHIDTGDAMLLKLTDDSHELTGSEFDPLVSSTCVDSDREMGKENIDTCSPSNPSSMLARPGPREATLHNVCVSNSVYSVQAERQNPKPFLEPATVLKPLKSSASEREKTYMYEFQKENTNNEKVEGNTKVFVQSRSESSSIISDNSLTFSEEEHDDDKNIQKLRDTVRETEYTPAGKEESLSFCDNSLTFTQSKDTIFSGESLTENSCSVKFHDGDEKRCKANDHESYCVRDAKFSERVPNAYTSFGQPHHDETVWVNEQEYCNSKPTGFIAKHLYDDNHKIRSDSISQLQGKRCGHCPLFDVKHEDQYRSTRGPGSSRPNAPNTMTRLRRSSALAPPEGDIDTKGQPSLISAIGNNLGQFLHNMPRKTEGSCDLKSQKLLSSGKNSINGSKNQVNEGDDSARSVSLDMSPFGVSDANSLQFTNTADICVSDDSSSNDSDVFTLDSQIF